MSLETLNQINKNSIKEKLLELKLQILGKWKENNPQQSKEKKYESEPKNVPSTREYKIYKLWLGSIVPIKWDIQKAMVKITNNPKLSKNISQKDIEFENIIPSILKESMMDNDARSSSWAVGYFQLKQAAVDDVVNKYWLKDLKLDPKNPVDNIIIWSLYRKILLERLKQWLNNLSDSDLEKIRILSYNAGDWRIKKLFKESNSRNYKEFEKFLAKKLWVTKNPVKKTDKIYWVEYIDPLPDLNINKLQWENKKIAEWLRYVAIIDWISWYIKSNETMEILWNITINKNTTLYSSIKDLRDRWIFKENASIGEICKIVLDSNWYWERETPEWTELLIIKDALIDYLP